MNRSSNTILIVVMFTIALNILAAGCSDPSVAPAEPVVPPDHWAESRTAWSLAAAPHLGRDVVHVQETGDDREFLPERRIDTRWFLPRTRVERRFLEPDVVADARRKTVSTLEMFLKDQETNWPADAWGGIECGLGPSGIRVSPAGVLEVWINDFTVDPTQRRGCLHFDFGFLSEDFFWPRDHEGALELGTFQYEDINGDGMLGYGEDIGLDLTDDYYDDFSPEYHTVDNPYPGINNTSRNNRLDTEDLDENGYFDTSEVYYTLTVDLASTEAYIDVLNEYTEAETAASVDMGIAWRCYRLPIADSTLIYPIPVGRLPDLNHVSHLRIWYEDIEPGGPSTRRLQLARMNFIEIE